MAVVRKLSIVLVLVVVAACGDDEADPLEPRQVPVLEIDTAGDPVCLKVEGVLAEEVETLPVIGCDVPHTHEIYDTIPYTETDVYPGVAELSSFAQVECLTAFETFVGISAFDSSLSYTWIVPTLNSWNDEGDRDVLCVLTNRADEELVGSKRSSRA